MLNTSMDINILTSVFIIAFSHTIIGVDHYLPFIFLSKANNWSFSKTILLTLFCGLIHIISALGISYCAKYMYLPFLSTSFRSSIVGWLFISFGLIYLLISIKKSLKDKYKIEYLINKKTIYTMLFTVFLVGPCEPLIPIVLLPSLQGNTNLIIISVLTFSITTIFTMILSVAISLQGINMVFKAIPVRLMNIIAGLILIFCGSGILFLEL